MLGDLEVEIVSVIKSWTEESLHDRRRKRYFKVKGSDGFTYTLYYDESNSAWFLAGE